MLDENVLEYRLKVNVLRVSDKELANVYRRERPVPQSADGFLLTGELPFRLDRCSFVRSFSSAITVSVISFSSHSP